LLPAGTAAAALASLSFGLFFFVVLTTAGSALLARFPARVVWIAPLGLCVLSAIFVSTAVSFVQRRPVTWKGRSYEQAGSATSAAGPALLGGGSAHGG
jgi:hypothetical protein